LNARFIAGFPAWEKFSAWCLTGFFGAPRLHCVGSRRGDGRDANPAGSMG
jgi:hypothetical protein